MTKLAWKDFLEIEKEKDYFKNILGSIENARANGKVIYPSNQNMFNALKLTELSDIKAVILGQDPYHGPNQAHGLAFSVNKEIPKPPSLKNIFKELNADLGIREPGHGNLEGWAKEGVLLLNSVLSVQANNAGSHREFGWEEFTDKVIEIINDKLENVVFLLWGSYAQKKASFVDASKHCILKAPHPSPLSAHRGFLGCKHFSKTNDYLKSVQKNEINWENF